MTLTENRDRWTGGEAYQRFMGRWSPFLASQFVQWLNIPPERDWLDVGCGTGALTRAILEVAQPNKVVGIDPSEAFVAYAKELTPDSRAEFRTGSGMELPLDNASFDAVASGLVLNFIPNAEQAMKEMRRVVRDGGSIGAYVWDYANGMVMLRYFWDAVIALDPAAEEHDEGPRFPLNNPDALERLFTDGGLQDVQTRALEFSMRFESFDDYWQPFLGGVGPGPAYVVGLAEEKRVALVAKLKSLLPIQEDGSFDLPARAWAVKGFK
jgi:SAM-dependent methyltransferase